MGAEQAMDLLLWLFEIGGSAQVDELGSHMWEALGQIINLDTLNEGPADYRGMVADDVRYLLHRYAEVGVVKVLDEERVIDATGQSSASGGRVEIEPVGWLLCTRLADEVSGDHSDLGGFGRGLRLGRLRRGRAL
jgi:hypothetical protein